MRDVLNRVISPTFLLPTALGLIFISGFRGFSQQPLLPYGAWLALGVQALAIVAIFFQRFRYGKPDLSEKVALSLLFIFTGVAAVSLTAAGDHLPVAIQRFVLILGFNIPLLLVVLHIPEPEKVVNGIARVILGIGVVLSAYSGLVVFLSEDGRGRIATLGNLALTQCSFGTPTSLRLCSLTGNPNHFSLILLLATIALLYLFLHKKLPWLAGAVILFVLAYGQYLTLSRTGIFATGIAVVLTVLFSWLQRRPKWPHILGVIAGAAAAVFVFLQISGTSRLLRSSLSGREALWEALVSAIQLKPWLGVGFGVSVEAIIAETGRFQSAHNLYLALASEVGIPGLAVFLLFWLVTIFLALRKLHAGRPEMLFVAVFLASMLVHQIAELQVLRNGATNTLFFIALGIALSPTRESGVANQKEITE